MQKTTDKLQLSVSFEVIMFYLNVGLEVSRVNGILKVLVYEAKHFQLSV